jgi:hypothetical protein
MIHYPFAGVVLLVRRHAGLSPPNTLEIDMAKYTVQVSITREETGTIEVDAESPEAAEQQVEAQWKMEFDGCIKDAETETTGVLFMCPNEFCCTIGKSWTIEKRGCMGYATEAVSARTHMFRLVRAHGWGKGSWKCAEVTSSKDRTRPKFPAPDHIRRLVGKYLRPTPR